MEKVIVTGVAGFIGSHLAELLLTEGYQVIGIDCFLEDSYDSVLKRANLKSLSLNPRFTFFQIDLRQKGDDLTDAAKGAKMVFHLAAMPGLPLSWENTRLYIDCNVIATQNLIEVVDKESLVHFVHISTSSVYGLQALGDENDRTFPISPYGATKLAAEELLLAQNRVNNLPLTILRYFSVYGPRQRPDMAYTKFIHKILNGEPIEMFGDGTQTRSNTFVLDAVRATIEVSKEKPTGQIFNVGGKQKIQLLEAIEIIGSQLGVKPRIQLSAPRLGDQLHTFADTQKLQSVIGNPFTTDFELGIKHQISWVQSSR
jgi:UDP-glucuronate 4-epimerase